MGRAGESYTRLFQSADQMRQLKGKPADIALWPIASFAAKPKPAIKAGLIYRAVMGDPNGAIPAAARPSVTFVSAAAYDARAHRELGLSRRVDAEIAAVPPPQRLNLAQLHFNGMMQLAR